MLTFQCVKGRGFSSGEIAWFGGGIFSHVDCVLPDGRLLGARSDKIAGPAGVQIRPAGYEDWKTRVQFSIQTNAHQEKRFYDFLNLQVGKPYDPLAIWGFVFGRAWRDTDAWICSELQCAALEEAKIVKPLYLASNRITPNAFALLLSAL